MLTAILAALLLQQAAPAGPIVWETPVAPEIAVEAEAEPSTVRPTSPVLPAWALADPFAWERSQCNPLIRREQTMEICQARVRTQLADALGDALPPGLAPSAVPEACVPAATEGGGFAVTCKPPERAAVAPSAPREQVCDSRPQRLPNGGLSFASDCRPASGDTRKDGLAFRLGGRD